MAWFSRIQHSNAIAKLCGQLLGLYSADSAANIHASSGELVLAAKDERRPNHEYCASIGIPFTRKPQKRSTIIWLSSAFAAVEIDLHHHQLTVEQIEFQRKTQTRSRYERCLARLMMSQTRRAIRAKANSNNLPCSCC